MGCRILLKAVFLTDAFYKDYPNAKFGEIEQKTNRPYIRIQIMMDGVLWGIPMRSNISHNHAIWTNEEEHCGLDLSKAVVIAKPAKYVSCVAPHIRDDEFKELKKLDEYTVSQKLQKYIRDYKKAKKALKVKRNRDLVLCSTLQYFEKYI